MKKFKIITCLNINRVIGDNNKLLYKIKNDLSNFKRITSDNVVIMGRKTFDSLPNGALPNRINIVITRDQSFVREGVIVVNSISEAIKLCESSFIEKEWYVIGGGQIYNEFLSLDLVDTMYITTVFDEYDGDTKFPLYDESKWKVFYQSNLETDNLSKKDYVFQILVKKD